MPTAVDARGKRWLSVEAQQGTKPEWHTQAHSRARGVTSEGGSVEFDIGTYRAGDGDAYSVAGNVGLPLGPNGFANLSLEYGHADPTNRSVQRADVAALIAAGNTDVADPAQIWGDPTVEDDLKLFRNFGSLLGNGLQLYGHANYASKRMTEGFYFRNPNNRAKSYSLDGGETLLVGDVLQGEGPRQSSRRSRCRLQIGRPPTAR